MLRFFAGILLAQSIAVLFTSVLLDTVTLERLLLLSFPIVLVAIIVTLWLRTIAVQMADKRLQALKADFAKEREHLNVHAERAKTRLVKQTQKEIASETRKARNSANFKVGAAITVATGFGLIMLFSQMITLGLLTLTTAGGAVGGYLARSRRDSEALPGSGYKVIEAAPETPSTREEPRAKVLAQQGEAQ